ncbi:hypothetical protein GOZ89_17030 [Agrobacterium vitis]|uniref:hypothetical protein n=1 Tax=Agrobacterium vitis TaxID=373 RepID=UPI0012E83BF2|nr:hypothetical protein [Agrobacterium vitis]MVA81130.1 hypothetical protein [Agrobacterium vitis]
MLLTKHCTPENRQRMLLGHFRIGTHGEYSKGEKTGLLSDTAEGIGATQFIGDIKNASWRIGSNIFENITIIGAGEASLHLDERVNYNIFCASKGLYNRERHQKLLNGVENYEKNPDITDYVIIKRDIFKRALQCMSDHMFGVDSHWISQHVKYGNRISQISSNEIGKFKYDGRRRLIDAAFTKPEKFSVEDEWRYVLVKKASILGPEPIYTCNLPDNIIDLFKQSVFHSDSYKG